MAFPATNITLKEVCDGYGVASNMGALAGKIAYDINGNPFTVPAASPGNNINLGFFSGRYSFNPTQKTLPDVTVGNNDLSKSLTFSNINYTVINGAITTFSCSANINWSLDGADEAVVANFYSLANTYPNFFVQKQANPVYTPYDSLPWTVSVSGLNITDGIKIGCGAGYISGAGSQYFDKTITYTLTGGSLTGPVIS